MADDYERRAGQSRRRDCCSARRTAGQRLAVNPRFEWLPDEHVYVAFE
jgi:hypothetical protein